MPLTKIAKYTPQERQDYEESLKTFRDWYSVIKTAENKGLAKGREEEREKAYLEKLESARNLKSLGTLSITQIATALSLTEVDVINA